MRDLFSGAFARRWLGRGLVVMAALGLAACEEEVKETVTHVRAIKTITVSERASGQERKFSGLVEAVDTSSLSFEVAGNVQELRVEVGDKVTKGQALAALDTKTFELNVQSSEASLGRAKANFAEKKTEFDRQDTLYKKGWVALSAQEQAKAGLR